MASYNEAEPLESTLSWNYSVRVPPYTLHDRVMPSWLTLDDLNDVGLSSLPYPILDDVLRSTPEERARTARRLRRIVLGVLFRNMYQHETDVARMFRDVSESFGGAGGFRGWQRVGRRHRPAFPTRQGEGAAALHTGTRNEDSLIHVSQSDLNNPSKPAHPKHATYHLVGQFFTLLDGTVWLEVACNEETELSQRKAVGDRMYRNSLVRQVVNRVAILQRALIESCRTAGIAADGWGPRPPEWRDYEAAAEMVEDQWEDVEEAELWV